MKICTKCKIEKPLSEFYKRPNRPLGVCSQCKKCTSLLTLKASKQYRKTETGRRNSILALRRFAKKNPEKIKEYRNKWRNSNPLAYKSDYEKADPYKLRARYTLRNAIASGKIIRPKICSECGWEGMIHGHHSDYSKPLDVEWLCSLCHGKKHRDSTIP